MGNQSKKPTRLEMIRSPAKYNKKWQPNRHNNIKTPNDMKISTPQGKERVEQENASGRVASFNRKNKCRSKRVVKRNK
jgi:hypothetical protein